MIDLRPLFQSLPPAPPSVSGLPVFSASILPSHPELRIARDSENRALFLIDIPAGESPARPPIVLENLRVEHARQCTVRSQSGDTASGTFTIVSCTSPDTALRDHFLVVLGALAGTVGAPVRSERVSAAITSIV